jgi:hypothetical protein
MVPFLIQKPGHNLFKNGIFIKIKVLPDITDAVMFRNAYGSGVRRLFTDDDSKKGCFSVAVEADQSNSFLRIEFETGALKQNLRTKAFVEILNTDHMLSDGKAG